MNCLRPSLDVDDGGMKVTLANGGDEAFSILQNEAFDFVLADIKMPKGDGIELLEKMKSANIKTVATYLMTGYSDYPEEKLKSLGMTALYKKPVDTDLLIEELKKLIE